MIIRVINSDIINYHKVKRNANNYYIVLYIGF